MKIPSINEQVMERIPFIKQPGLIDYMETDKIARIYAEEIILKGNK
jgi:hypothetical protein